MKVLIIEDEPSLQELIKETLEKERYIVECASTYLQGMRKLEDYSYACVVLDIMLPDGSGLKLLEELKKMNKRDAVIIISAKDSLEDKLVGLQLGADDYLAKPFYLVELLARIKTVIRRTQRDGEVSTSLGNMIIYPEQFRVVVHNKYLELNRKEYDILIYFVNRRNRLINKNVLVEAVWGDHIDQINNFDFIYAQIKNLRKKLKDSQSGLDIKAVYGIGYKLIEE